MNEWICEHCAMRIGWCRADCHPTGVEASPLTRRRHHMSPGCPAVQFQLMAHRILLHTGGSSFRIQRVLQDWTWEDGLCRCVARYSACVSNSNPQVYTSQNRGPTRWTRKIGARCIQMFAELLIRSNLFLWPCIQAELWFLFRSTGVLSSTVVADLLSKKITESSSVQWPWANLICATQLRDSTVSWPGITLL